MENERLRFRRTGMPGFTLIELLVVISIICLLMSISLPSLTNARQQGYRVACMSNMRGLTQAWFMYAFENDEMLCSSLTGWDLMELGHWVADGEYIPGNEIGGTADAIRAGRLWPYTGRSLHLYKCKSDASDVLRSYMISNAMNGWGHGDGFFSYKRFRRWHQITQSSERLVFIDGQSLTSWIDGPFELHGIPGHLSLPSAGRRGITARHSDGCNISLADGHCEYWKYRDPRTRAEANGDSVPYYGVNNPDIERAMALLGLPRETSMIAD